MEIDSKLPWNKTGFRVTAGRQYHFRATGTWKDASNACGPDGYSLMKLMPFVPLRRFKRAKWFALIGTVEGADAFVIGSDRQWTATRSGELWCYANDVSFMYKNNEGSVTLNVEEA
jgi:hypothetical protein